MSDIRTRDIPLSHVLKAVLPRVRFNTVMKIISHHFQKTELFCELG